MAQKNHNLQGIEHLEKGRYQKAVKFFNRALEEDPENLAVINNLALALAEMGDKKEAVRTIKKALKKCDHEDGYYKTLRNNLAKIHKMKVKQPEEPDDEPGEESE